MNSQLLTVEMVSTATVNPAMQESTASVESGRATVASVLLEKSQTQTVPLLIRHTHQPSLSLP